MTATPAVETAGKIRTTARWSGVARVAAPILAGALVALAPVPQGLPANAWYYFALFLAVMVGIITEPLPPAPLCLLGIAIAATAGLVHTSIAQSTQWALSGFSNSTVWLIFAAYMFALGYAKTGLGLRISLLLIRGMGKKTLGLGYAIAFADLALAPFMPSNTARSAGTIYPVIRSIPELYGSHPNSQSARKIGAYLLYTALAVTCVTSSMFLTGLAPNVLAAGLVFSALHVSISWMDWFRGFAPAGLVLFLLTPVLVYKIFPPEIKDAPDAPRWAAEQLRSIGPITAREIKLLVLVLTALVLWIGAAKYIDVTITAVLVVVLMVVLKVVSWNEIIGNAQAWNVLAWFAALVTLAGGLVDTHFVAWADDTLAPGLAGHGVVWSIALVVGAFFFVHYFFASITAHTTALLPVFLAVAVKVPGIPPKTWALLLSYTLGLMGILTTYATGPSPIYYGSGYIKNADFWRLGLVLGLVFFGAYVAIEIPWLLFLKL